MKVWQASYQLLLDLAQQEEKLAKIKQVEQSWYALSQRTSETALFLLGEWLKAEVEFIGAKGVLLGVSGGVDSSLCALLLARALPERSLALLMPGFPSPEDDADALCLLKLLKLPYRRISLAKPVQDFLNELKEPSSPPPPPSPLVLGNLVSRLRNAALYYLANLNNYLVLGSGDLDEVYLGYSTKGTTSDLFPLNGLHKEEVRSLLKLGLTPYDPEFAARIAQKPASPGYWPGQQAEAELGLSYLTLGKALAVMLETCEIWRSGVLPRRPAEFQAALAKSGVSEVDFLTACALVKRNYHKSFGSPALQVKK